MLSWCVLLLLLLLLLCNRTQLLLNATGAKYRTYIEILSWIEVGWVVGLGLAVELDRVVGLGSQTDTQQPQT